MKKIYLLSLLFIASLVSCGSINTSTPITGEKEISSIEIIERPNQTVFALGETLDLTGLKVKVNYSDSTFNYVGPASLTYSESVSSTSQNSIILKYEGFETSLTGLEFRESKKNYFEAESKHAYWSKPNNHNKDTFFVVSEDVNAHGGKYVSGLSKECFALSYMFYADELVSATFKFGSDVRTTTYSQNLSPTTPSARPLSEMYEFHVNGLKVDLTGDVVNGEWGEYREISLGTAKLRKGLNTVSLTHILRNGENGNIDYICVDTVTKIETTDYSRQLIEAEDMQVSGGDHKTEGNGASKTGKNQNADNVGNRANGQTGWLMTTVNSEKTQTAALYINFGLCAKFNLTDWEISVNNEVVKYVDVFIPYHFWEGIAWKDWNEFYVCELQLQKGENLIKIEKVDASTDGTNIDYIVLLTAN